MAAPSVDDENTCTTLFITNLPPDASNDALEQLFDDIGPVKRCFAIRDKSSDLCKGFGYVTFAVREDAVAAADRKFKLGGRVLTVKFAKSKTSTSDKPEVLRNVDKDELKRKRKELRKQKNRRKGRLIIRNLSFSVKEDSLRNLFERFGDIVDVTVRKDDKGRSKGFAFLQFKETKSAIKAINALNAKEIEGRPVAIDFAIPKSKYGSLNIDTHESERKNESLDLEGDKEETKFSENETSRKVLVKKRKHSASSDEDDSQDPLESDLSDTDTLSKKPKKLKVKSKTVKYNDESGTDDSDEESEHAHQPKKRENNTENTLFIRNLSYSTENDTLQELMKTFGPVKYCLLCVDDITDHPKGTAFVQFVNKTDAEKCLEKANSLSEEGLYLDGRKLVVSEALSREKLEEKMKEKKKDKKDNRNLYLAREGLIRAGTLAAEGVSQTDLAKRMRLQERKRRLLRNLHYFISTTRLCIYNLPLHVDDKELRKLCLKAVDDRSARITEARVMKDLKKLNVKGGKKSKGFGFVNFTEHEHALKALRELNNNPTVFKSDKRPIVEFSVENKAALVAKQKRMERSKLKATAGTKASHPEKTLNRSEKGKTFQEERNAKNKKFMGFKSSKEIKGLPSHAGPKVRHKKRGQKGISKKPNKQTQKKQFDTKKQSRQKNKMFEKAPKSDIRDEKSFQNLVNKYKKNLGVQNQEVKRQKWFKE